MKIKKVAPVIVVIVLLLCSVAIIQKNKTTTQYEPSIEVAIEQNYTLSGKSDFTGEDIPIEVFIKKAVLSSGAIAIFQNYQEAEDVSFSGVKDIVIHVKNGKVYNLWNDCKDKSVSYNKETNEAVTYILFSKTIPLKNIEAIEVSWQKFEINSEINDENM